MKIERKKNKYIITREVTEEVDFKMLEAELENTKIMKAEADEFNEWVDSLPEERQRFISKLYIAIPDDLEEKIEKIKELNGDTIIQPIKR